MTLLFFTGGFIAGVLTTIVVLRYILGPAENDAEWG